MTRGQTSGGIGSAGVPLLRLQPLARNQVADIAALAGRGFHSSDIQAEVAAELDFYCVEGLQALPLRQQVSALPRSYYVGVVAQPDGQEVPVGLTGLYRFTWASPTEVWLGWFVVDAQLQGMGLGRELLLRTLDIARSLSFESMLVETLAGGRAVKFYTNNGFCICGTFPAHYGHHSDACVLWRPVATDDVVGTSAKE